MAERRTIIVTGASRGLGAATARSLGAMGANVVLNARSQADLEVVAGEVDPAGQRVLVVSGDVSRADECRRLVEATVDRFGRLDASSIMPAFWSRLGRWLLQTLMPGAITSP